MTENSRGAAVPTEPFRMLSGIKGNSIFAVHVRICLHVLPKAFPNRIEISGTMQ